MYHLTVLANKLKIITCPIPGAHGVTASVFVGVGSRYESDNIAGISHFAEHMFYKGTTKRPTAADVSRSIEGIGGYTNAATSHDYTFFYNRVPALHFARAIEVLSDIIVNSLFQPEAIEREKGVILEELNMYLDTPTRYIYDLIMQTVWPGTTLGRNIIGTRKSIRAIQRQNLIKYLSQTYQPQNMAIAVAGKIKHNQAVSLVKKYFPTGKNSRLLRHKKIYSNHKKPQISIYTKETDQTHLCLAFPALPRQHRQEAVLSVLNAILGTGMSSRLFLNIREKKGLCYSIQSFVEKFNETGIFGISAGLNSQKIYLSVREIVAELSRLTSNQVSHSELALAKEYLRGDITLQLDNTDSMVAWYGSQALFYKKIQTPAQKIKQLLSVTENDIIKLAKYLFGKNKPSLAIIGPYQQADSQKFAKLLKI